VILRVWWIGLYLFCIRTGGETISSVSGVGRNIALQPS
jgi:hypothetical protein